MTHSNHRRGSRESLLGDWVVFSRGGEISDAKGKKIMEILTTNNPVGASLGRGRGARWMKGWTPKMNSGTLEVATLEEIRNKAFSRGGCAVYDNIENVENVLKELGEADLGYSIVVAGIFDELTKISKNAGLKNAPHTTNMSAETFGKTDRLPEPAILEITTMCGHDYVGAPLVKHVIEQVKLGRMSPEYAAVELGKQCTCNFFNVARAVKLINAYIGN